MNRLATGSTLFGTLAVLSSLATAQDVPYLQLVMSDSTADYWNWYPPTVSPDGRWLAWSTVRSELWIRAVAGGQPRLLSSVKGDRLQFTPQGDRVVFVSPLPRRGPEDDATYLMSAPFDSRTGGLSAAPRQITFDPVVAYQYISPNGQRVAYTDRSGALKWVPITGGSAMTVLAATPPRAGGGIWSGNQALRYQVRERGNAFSLFEIDATGGTPRLIATQDSSFQRLLPGHDVSVRVISQRDGTKRLRLLDANREAIGPDLELPGVTGDGGIGYAFGKYLVLGYSDILQAGAVVPTGGGPVRLIPPEGSSEWISGWTADSRAVVVSTGDERVTGYRAARTDGGRTLWRVPRPDSLNAFTVLGSSMVMGQISARTAGADVSFWLVDERGSRRLLARGVLDRPRLRGRDAIVEHYYLERAGATGLELRAVNAAATDRLVTDLPLSFLGRDAAVTGDGAAWSEEAGDTVRLFVKRNGGQVAAIGSYPKTLLKNFLEPAWSRDGRQLAVIDGWGRQLDIYRFDAAGRNVGAPRRIELPFDAANLSWLADGSGITMSASLPDRMWWEIALIKLADAAHPIFLANSAQHYPRGGCDISPDGRLCAFQTERTRGGRAWLLDIEKAVAEARRRRPQ